MVHDASLKLYDAALNTVPNTDVAGTWIGLGNVGLPQGTQFIVGVDNAGGEAGDNPTVKFQLELTLDNNATRKKVTEFEIDPSTGFDGQLVRECGGQFEWGAYPAANINVRFILSPVSDNASNNVTADRVYAYLGHGARRQGDG